jgi:hypothetical protein
MKTVIPPQLKLLCELITQQTAPTLTVEAWENIIALAQTHEVQTILAWYIAQKSIDLPQNLQDKLISSTRQSVARYALLACAQKRITTALSHAAIPHIWLKGMVLAQTIYPAAFHREMLDMDVLVPYEQRLQALLVLENIGYRQIDDDHSLFDPNELAHHDQMHHFLLRGGAGNGIILELHFQLLGGDSLRLSKQYLAWFWQHTMTIKTEKFSFVGFTPEAHLLYLCAHIGLHHGLHEFVLKRYLDLHLLMRQTTISWETVITQAVELRWTYVVEQCLVFTQELFNTPIPVNVLLSLREKRHADENTYAVDAIKGAGAQFEMVWILLNERSWRERLHVLYRILFPPAAYMRQHYHIPQNQAIWRYYVKRWLHQLQQFGFALQQRLSKRHTNQSR